MGVINRWVLSFSVLFLLYTGAVSYKLPKRKGWFVSLPIMVVAYCFLVTIFPGENAMIEACRVGPVLLYFSATLLVLVAMQLPVFKVGVDYMFFNAVIGWSVQHFVDYAFRFLKLTTEWDSNTLIIIKLVVAICLVTVIALFFAPIHKNVLSSINPLATTAILVFFVLFLDFFGQLENTIIKENNPTAHAIFYVANLAIIVLMVSLLVSSCLSSKAKQDNDMLEAIIKKQNEHYAIAEANIENINVKIHDLKKQMYTIRKSGLLADEMAKQIKQVEKNFNIFEMFGTTGSKSLDIIIADKVLAMKEYKIRFTCLADGKCIDFISYFDMCSIVGNALDNAMEASMKEDDDKRIITLKIVEQAGTCFINVLNYCSTAPIIEKGLVKTTKKDKTSHGFGIKSIIKNADKYGGTVKVSFASNCFSLLVAIPKKG